MYRSVPGQQLRFSTCSRRRQEAESLAAEPMPQSQWVWLEPREQRLPGWRIGPRLVAANLAALAWCMDCSTQPLRPATSHRCVFGRLTRGEPDGDLLCSAWWFRALRPIWEDT